jgi:ABC-type sulfate/molybdate transport systems ATPase subunit
MLSAELRHPLRAFVLDLALEVEPGTCLALAGPSGAGKTSVLRMIAGLLRAERADVRCGGELWDGPGVRVAPERRRCGFLFQDYALFAHMSAWENVAYGLRGPRARRRAEATALLARFDVAELAGARPRQLSGGERQRVALARALARPPAALLLDEPLSALDAATRADATHALRTAVAEAGAPTLLVTHDFTEAAVLADRVAVVEDGRVQQEGSAATLAAEPRSAFVASFTGATTLRGFAARRGDGLTAIALDGGGTIVAADQAQGRVTAVVHPWDVTLEDPGAPAGSAQNRIVATVMTLTPAGNRLRVGLHAGQPLAAEVTGAGAARLGLVPGSQVLATWKATATRLVPEEYARARHG